MSNKTLLEERIEKRLEKERFDGVEPPEKKGNIWTLIFMWGMVISTLLGLFYSLFG